jgi:hypothetical protein
LALGLAAALAIPFVANPFRQPTFLVDFRGDLYAAGQAILRGETPYHDSSVARQAAIKRAGGQPQLQFAVPLFPAPTLVAVTPISLLPYELAGSLWLLFSITALLLALRLLGVKDPRCLALTFVWMPVLHGLVLGALEPMLVLGTAVVWRWRHSLKTPAVAIASVVVAKLVLWPLGAWLLLTRRFRTFALAVTVAAAGTLAAWALIGFAGMTDYPRMLSNLSFLEQADGISLTAVLLAVGATPLVAHAIALIATGALLLAAWLVLPSPGGERRAFGLAILAGLTSSTIAWPQFLAVLVVPIALSSPSLSWPWFVPLLAWLAPVPRTHGHLLPMLPFVAIEAIIVLWLCSTRLQARQVEAHLAGASPVGQAA